VVKICLECHEVNAGGYRCVDCGGRLVLTSDPEAKALPESVWKNQRVDYGARRGMIVRFLAIFAGAGLALFGVRESIVLESPWSWISAVGSLVGGVALWWLLYRAAGRGVRVWILAKGRVHKGRLARAALSGVLPRRKRA
jgi:hypothetical protein